MNSLTYGNLETFGNFWINVLKKLSKRRNISWFFSFLIMDWLLSHHLILESVQWHIWIQIYNKFDSIYIRIRPKLQVYDLKCYSVSKLLHNQLLSRPTMPLCDSSHRLSSANRCLQKKKWTLLTKSLLLLRLESKYRGAWPNLWLWLLRFKIYLKDR